MIPAERGFLMLSSCLGDTERRPLTTAQLRQLSERAKGMREPLENRDLEPRDLVALGYSRESAERIWYLLQQEDVLEHYLRRGIRAGCVPITRISAQYPRVLSTRLGEERPGVLWAKGDVSLLERPLVSLVGSRDLGQANAQFAREAGRQAGKQGWVLVSGNARGADRIAQEACLSCGGAVISVVADRLDEKLPHPKVLYLSEEDYDAPFSAQRALSRNRVIHALGLRTLVAQCTLESGGTWDGTTRNLRGNWSPVFCFRDGSAAMERLCQMGAQTIGLAQLQNIAGLQPENPSFFDQ